MKKIVLMFTGLIMSMGFLSAQYECCEPDCGSGFSVYADYLYWRVCETDLSFSWNTNGTNHTEYLNPCYDSGWRIGGAYRCGPSDIGVRYTDYSNTSKKVLTNPPFSQAGTAVFKFDYHVVDIEVGYTLPFDCDRYFFRPFAGAKFAWVNESHDDILDSDLDRQDFDGYGLYLGAEGRFVFCRRNVCCCDLETSLVLRGSYGILESTSKTKTVSDFSETIREGECLFVSTVEVFAGVAFAYSCSECFTPELLLGYEANTLIGWREMDSSNDRATLGLGGLVARLRLDF